MDLERFLTAQKPVYANVLQELRQGDKTSHWMWFIFPQLAVLGRSSTARFYGIENLEHARAYLAHPVLGERLKECAAILLTHKYRSAHDILHSPDDLKLRSCMTLFASAAPDEAVFSAVLQQFYGGKPDPLTLQVLGQ